MNQPTEAPSRAPAHDAEAQAAAQAELHQRIRGLLAAQQAACMAQPPTDAAQRRAQLLALKQAVLRRQALLVQAMSQDFGHRAAAESQMLDVLGSVLALDHAARHVRRWMKPSRRRTEWLFAGNRLQVHHQPKGVVAVVVPWNFPVYLALGPLASALAAGNRVMVKMPEATPATNAALRAVLAEVFDEAQVALVGQEPADPAFFTSLPFDHILFTGSPAVGRRVMRAAAEHLTPVTLELGGKSPALVGRRYPLADAARRVAHGKAANSGQICVSPDHVLVPREQLPAFVAAVQAAWQRFYGGVAEGNADCTAIVNPHHQRRLLCLLDDARERGAQVLACGPMPRGEGRQLPLHIVVGATPDMAVMTQELFGPILPVLPYDTLDDAIAFINAGPRPLALYCFSHDAAERTQVLERTRSGGVTFNDWGWHVVNHDAPFGGIGGSGMGAYHGHEGFLALSHARTVFTRRRWFPSQLFHPPYGGLAQRMVLRWFLG